jgi:hypothetical protein
LNILAVVGLITQGGTFPTGQASSPVSIQGTFFVLWGDGVEGSGEKQEAYFLVASQADPVRLVVSDDQLYAAGGVLGLNRRQVVVQGTWLEEGERLLVQSVALALGEQAGPEGIFGPQPWVSILCKFRDVPDEPNDLNYFQQMYSADYPGLDHFWRQNSYELANLEGSGAYGWFVLPHDRAYYLPGGNLDWWTAAAECTAAADPYVDFSPYVGINLMFNDLLDCCAWGGTWYACLDGECQNWRTTWEPPWGYQNIGVIAHETGHGFGLPHSLGNCQGGYDNRWDVLSDVWSNGSHPVYGTMGQHTIAYHKESLEWLNEAQVFTSAVGTRSTISLERLALPGTNNYLGAGILINNSTTHFYTLEVRQPTNNPIDYDKWLPGFAVIIHDVDIYRSEPAVVVDLDGNCNTGDAGSMYTVGEVYRDELNGISMSVDSVTASGYVVTINNRFTEMEEVVVSGVSEGYIGESIPFKATVSPEDATTPITYTWEATGLPPLQHVGGTTDQVELLWEEVGSKVVTVTASNGGGTVNDTHTVNIGHKIPIVTINGPEMGEVGEEFAFTASVLPEDVPQPITYTWQASGQQIITHTAGLSDTVNYEWEMPGMQAITVTASNGLGATTDYYEVQVVMAPISLDVMGVAEGVVGVSNTFTATVSPITTTVPMTYIWDVDGDFVYTHTAGLSDTVLLSWGQPGMHQVVVTVTNPAGSVQGDWTVTVYVRVYFPAGYKH